MHRRGCVLLRAHLLQYDVVEAARAGRVQVRVAVALVVGRQHTVHEARVVVDVLDEDLVGLVAGRVVLQGDLAVHEPGCAGLARRVDDDEAVGPRAGSFDALVTAHAVAGLRRQAALLSTVATGERAAGERHRYA